MYIVLRIWHIGFTTIGITIPIVNHGKTSTPTPKTESKETTV